MFYAVERFFCVLYLILLFYKFKQTIRMNPIYNNNEMQSRKKEKKKKSFVSYHFVPMIDSTLKEIVDFFSIQDAFLDAEISS